MSFGMSAQDKLFFSNGLVKTGIVVSIAKEVVYFRSTDTSAMQEINKKELVMVENYRGVRYLFSTKEKASLSNSTAVTSVQKRNFLGMQPMAILVGRFTVVYERLNKTGSIGLVIPFSLTFDPFGSLYRSRIDTSRNVSRRISGINYITGVDLNFYLGKTEHFKFFLGPRIRYGTDQFLRGAEGYSIQTQFGWQFGKPDSKLIQHFSMGFGFVRILSSPLGLLIDPKQSYGWYSINYRVSIPW